MKGLLNEVTDTIHKHQRGEIDFQTRCGAISHVSHDNFQVTSVEQTIATGDVSKCGRCFDDGGGY